MKKLFYLLALTSCFAIGQTKSKPKLKPKIRVENPVDSAYVQQPYIASTSEIEYNYMTKGFRIEQETGLDRKKGYDLDMLKLFEADKYSFEFMTLKRSKTSVVGVIVKATDKVKNKVFYLGIPINNPDLEKPYYDSVLSMDSDMIYYYSQLSSSIIAPLVAAIYAK